MEPLLRHVYLYLDLFTLLGPLLLSFDRKVAYWRSWRYLFPGILLGAAVFIPWDMAFTAAGIWSFNADYLLGVGVGNLPLEEWLFFLVVPYASVFIYECWRCYTRPRWSARTVTATTILLFFFCLGMGLANLHRWYTALTFLLLAGMLVLHYQALGTRYLENAYVGWLITLLPFLFVNGVLTALPVVRYNDAENLGIRIYTIPFEDAFYGFLLYLIVLTVMEALRSRAQPPASRGTAGATSAAPASAQA